MFIYFELSYTHNYLVIYYGWATSKFWMQMIQSKLNWKTEWKEKKKKKEAELSILY